MNTNRVRFWIMALKITLPIVGIVWAVVYGWATSTHRDPAAFNWLVGLIGFCVLAVCIFGMDKLYQKLKDRL